MAQVVSNSRELKVIAKLTYLDWEGGLEQRERDGMHHFCVI
jgi:hypothetical protein